MKIPPIDRFLNLVTVPVEGSCWEWGGGKAGLGYGVFWYGTRQGYAHRFSYEHFRGPIPSGLHIYHLCRNPGCVNPDHLDVVTNRENALRGNVMKPVCPHGHSKTGWCAGPNGYSVLYCHVCKQKRNRERQAKKRLEASSAHERTGGSDCYSSLL